MLTVRAAGNQPVAAHPVLAAGFAGFSVWLAVLPRALFDLTAARDVERGGVWGVGKRWTRGADCCLEPFPYASYP